MMETKNVRHIAYIPCVGRVVLPNTARIEYLMQHEPIVPKEYTKLKMVLLTALVFVVALVIGTIIDYCTYWNYWVERHTYPGFFGAIYNTHEQIKTVFDIVFSYNHWEWFIKFVESYHHDCSFTFGLLSVFGMCIFWFVRDAHYIACLDRWVQWRLEVEGEWFEYTKKTIAKNPRRSWTVAEKNAVLDGTPIELNGRPIVKGELSLKQFAKTILKQSKINLKEKDK